MFRKRFVCLLAVAACLVGVAIPSLAAEVDSDSIYCFSADDFSYQAEPLCGICITELPDPSTGTVMLGTRVVQPGDIFTAEQLSMMTFCPVRTEVDGEATVSYLPIYENRVDPSAEMTISIRGKKDKKPETQNVELETYKNIPNNGALKAKDPEGQKLTYTVTRQPRRGQVTIREDGTFTYTPKKNKVGVDSFTFTATDPAGNVSDEATVTIRILKPSESEHYQDTADMDCRFEAEWLRNTGLFVGEKVGGSACFQPEKEVTKGQFLAMLLETLDVPVEEHAAYNELAENAPDWLRPYLAAAVRSGMMTEAAESFEYDMPITGAEAAMMLQNVLELPVQAAAEDLSEEAQALSVMNCNGIAMHEDILTRADVANILYQVSITDAPGKAIFRR